MAKSQLLRLVIAAAIVAAFALTAAEAGGEFSWTPAKNPATCKGSIAECMAGGAGGEFEMDTEINRRILATTQYISYGALRPDSVPCSRRGSSYYNNCQQTSQANPYTRSCTTVTRCSRS